MLIKIMIKRQIKKVQFVNIFINLFRSFKLLLAKGSQQAYCENCKMYARRNHTGCKL